MSRFPEEFKLVSGVWQPPQDDSITYTDGDSVEAYLTQILSDSNDLSSASPELINGIKDWPSRYHLSPERSNLLRPLRIKSDSSVLELGCGCGAITRYLGENTASVTAVEGSPSRAKIAKLRCRDLKNVEIAATNFDNISFTTKFDIVTLIGVLEYSAIFWRNDSDPFEGLLRLAWQNLADNGMLIIAIENKLGIKYLSGCSEDHLNRNFIGIEGYPDINGPRTFGRDELITLVGRSGFVDAELLLPFPDYKIPSTLINAAYTSADDCRVYNLVDWSRQPFLDYNKERENLFSDTLALGSLAENGLFSDCANSFLLIASKGPIGPESPISNTKWIACKYNMLRRPEYRTITTLSHLNGIPIIEKVRTEQSLPSKSSPVTLDLSTQMQFITGGTSLSMEMLRVLRGSEHVSQRFASLVSKWIKFLQNNQIKGTDNLPGEFIDCVPDNLIVTNDNMMHYIDSEWHWNIPVHIDWIIFRGLVGFWLNYKVWIASALMPETYTFEDYLSSALKDVEISFDRSHLHNLADLEISFQKSVVASPPIDFTALLENTYQEQATLDRMNLTRMKLDRTSAELMDSQIKIEDKNRELSNFKAELNGTRKELEDVIQIQINTEQQMVHANTARENLQKQLALQTQKAAELNYQISRLNTAATNTNQNQDNFSAASPIDIIIPVFNAFDETRACITSVIRHSDPSHRIYIVNDASTDSRIQPYLQRLASRYKQVHLVCNENNLGFIRTVNAAITATKGDVIILNSDTVVTSEWVNNLAAAAKASDQTGIVCPLSNNATILSVPNMNSNNSLPVGMSIDRFGELISEVSLKRYPAIPTVVGFCMYITRDCLNKTGLLDEIFGMGYGEENDFAMRAKSLGFEFRVADDTFVFHSGSTSFKTQSGNLDERKVANERLLGSRWPDYHRTILGFCILNPLRDVQQRIHDGISRWQGGSKPHVMHVVHSYHVMAGTELHTQQLACGLTPFFRSTVFFPGSNVTDSDAHTHIAADSTMELRYAVRNLTTDILFDNAPSSLSNVIVETNFERILRNSDVKIVHFQHLLNYGSFKLPVIARNLGHKVVITLHDYYYLCPIYNLVKRDRVTMCHRLGPDISLQSCRECMCDKFKIERKVDEQGMDAFLSSYLNNRREAVKEALLAADTIITPSTYVKEKYAHALGSEIGSKITAIPHGVIIPDRCANAEIGKQLRVAFLGNATRIKGFEVFGEAARRLRNRAVLMQSFGAGESELLQKYKGIVKQHGPYKPEDLPGILSKCDIVVIPSIWEETFCLTLSEAMAHGLPVVASDVGAMSERIIPDKNGLLFTVGDVDSLVGCIEKLLMNPGSVKEMKEFCRKNQPLSQKDMLEIYRDLYDELIMQDS